MNYKSTRHIKKISLIGFLCLYFFSLFGCRELPDGVLNEKQMQIVTEDVCLAEALSHSNYKDISSIEAKKALYQSVFEKHHITKAQYDSSLVWYGKNLDLYVGIYSRTINNLSERIDELGDIQSDLSTSPNKDSTDLWTRNRMISFSPQASWNIINFKINPAVNLLAGSKFVLSMDVWGIKPKQNTHIWVNVNIQTKDSTLSIEKEITQNGIAETIISAPKTKKVEQVFGSIRFAQPDSTYHKIWIDKISLFRYNYSFK